ncbi:MAG: glycerate kinase [Opitutales bacterium]|nr:glycerate kinase [Opitutales bacterium]
MRYLVAFDKFKDSMSAEMACGMAQEALNSVQKESVIANAPLTDGGEGFATILTLCKGGMLEDIEVIGPLGNPIRCRNGWVELSELPQAVIQLLRLPKRGNLAIVEMAQSSGLEQVPREFRSPFRTTSYGTGQVLKNVAESGAAGILLGIGGSATSDCGLGALQALGLNPGESTLPWAPQLWDESAEWHAHMVELPPLRIACDVNNPLLGKNGANAVYGPQKGLTAENYPKLEALFEQIAGRLIKLFHQDTDKVEQPGSGAAGGIGFGLSCAYRDTRYIPGFKLVSEWLELKQKVMEADCILTGEGRFDRSSLSGKGPGMLLDLARKHGKKVHVFAGKICDEAWEKASTGIFLHQIAEPGISVEEAIAREKELFPELIRKTFSD